MTDALATLGFILAAWLSFAAVTSLLVALAWRGSARLGGLHPRRRAAIALAAAIAPSALPTLLVLLCLAPGLAGALGWNGDHCLAHGDHPHLCLVHRTAELHAAVVAALLVAGGAAALVGVRAGRMLARTRRLLSALHASGRPEPGGLAIAPSAVPFSFTVGIARRGIWMSSALVDALRPEQLDVVLLHERAYLERRDPLRRAAATLLSLPLWPGVRRAILAELALATERACDELAGQRLGSRLRVAETLLAVERLSASAADAAPAGLPAFGETAVAARVRSLLDDPPAGPASPRAAWALVAAAALGLWIAADPLHHLMEHWLRLLLHVG